MKTIIHTYRFSIYNATEREAYERLCGMLSGDRQRDLLQPHEDVLLRMASARI